MKLKHSVQFLVKSTQQMVADFRIMCKRSLEASYGW